VETTERVLACVTSNIYRRLGHEVEKAFDSITLLDLASEESEQTRVGKC
jgi:DNA-binding IscR family transcriptional regulator